MYSKFKLSFTQHAQTHTHTHVCGMLQGLKLLTGVLETFTINEALCREHFRSFKGAIHTKIKNQKRVQIRYIWKN